VVIVILLIQLLCFLTNGELTYHLDVSPLLTPFTELMLPRLAAPAAAIMPASIQQRI
jgi:hypothetical protein